MYADLILYYRILAAFIYYMTCHLFLHVVLPAVVREERGPYSDPQHPYFYEEDDVWMAPGFINQFYEVSLVLFFSFLGTCF